MFCFLISSDTQNPKLGLLRELAQKLGYDIVVAETDAAALDNPALRKRSDSLVLVPALGDIASISAANVISFAGKLKGNGFLLYLTDEISPTRYKELLRTGAGDSVSWAGAISEIVSTTRRLRGEAPPSSADGLTSRPRSVVSFVSANGGVGNTTLALETAAHLTIRSKNRRTCAVVDLSFRRASTCDYLDLAPRLDVGEIVRNPQRLDAYMLDIFASKHKMGVDVFAADDNAEGLESPDEATVFSLLNLLTERYESVLLDLPLQPSAWRNHIMQNSDRIYLTGHYSVPSVRQISRERKRMEMLGIDKDRIAIIFNRCPSSFFGGIVRRSDLEQVLAGNQINYVRDGGAFTLDCINCGTSMVQTSATKSVCRDIAKIAAQIIAIEPRHLS